MTIDAIARNILLDKTCDTCINYIKQKDCCDNQSISLPDNLRSLPECKTCVDWEEDDDMSFMMGMPNGD